MKANAETPQSPSAVNATATVAPPPAASPAAEQLIEPTARPDRQRLLFRPNGIEAFLFSCRAAIAGMLAYKAYSMLGVPGHAWATVSALIVMQPTLQTSIRASTVRCLANVVGACAGALSAGMLGHTIFACMVGILLTGLLCHYLHLDASLASAYAATAIVILTVFDIPVWYGSLERVLAVVIGCCIGLLVTYIADKAMRLSAQFNIVPLKSGQHPTE